MPAACPTSPIGGTSDLRSLAVGGVVFSRFNLRRLLGQGGMGSVWLADDAKLDRQVALKFMPEAHFRDAGARSDLRKEARRSLELTHPNIVRIYDYMEDDAAAAISMEYIDGPTLAQMRVERREGVFEAEELGAWLAGCCDALDYAHEHASIVHRDLKPSNLMVNSRGLAKVADFGISCGLQTTAARISAWNHTGGTLGYMSPQQLRGELASPADDIYAFGATLFELLTGKPPFHSGDIGYQIREVEADTVGRRRKKLGLAAAPVPERWEKTIAACLSKDPAERPATVGEVAQRLGIGGGQRTNLASAPDSGRSLRFAPLSRRQAPKPPMRRLTLQRWYAIAVAVPVLAGWLLWPEARSDRPAPPVSADIAPPPPAAVPLTASAAVPLSTPIPTSPTEPARPDAPIPPSDDEMLKAVEAKAPGATVVSGAGQSVPAATATLEEPAAIAKALPPPAPPTGRLTIATEPEPVRLRLFAGSVVLPDAVPIHEGVPPLSFEGVPGSYTIVFDGGRSPSTSRVVDIAPNGLTDITQQFAVGAVQVTSQPAGAVILIDGKEAGFAPLLLNLPAGVHELGAEFKGRTAKIRKVDLAAGSTESLRFDFSASTPTRSKTRRSKRPVNESVLTKVGRSFQNLFTSDKKRR